MGTILDYLREYGDYSLEEKPFSDVDSLVISQLAYLKFDGIVPGPEEKVRWQQNHRQDRFGGVRDPIP